MAEGEEKKADGDAPPEPGVCTKITFAILDFISFFVMGVVNILSFFKRCIQRIKHTNMSMTVGV